MNKPSVPLWPARGRHDCRRQPAHDIVVRMPEELRADDEQIKKLPVRVGETGSDSAGKAGRVQDREDGGTNPRDDGQRRAALMVNLKMRDIEGFVREAERRIQEQVKLPENYLVEFGGQFENLQQARTRLAVVVPSALALIFVLIFLAFGSRAASVAGLFRHSAGRDRRRLALWLRGMPFSITAAVGFIALSGVAVLNGLVMISYFNQLREEGKTIRDSVIEGSLTRLASRADDALRRKPWLRADGDCDRRGRGSAASARDRRHRRHPQLHLPDAGVAAGALRLGRTENSWQSNPTTCFRVRSCA